MRVKHMKLMAMSILQLIHFTAYGSLSKQKLEDLIAGARVEVNDKKRNPLDFALWKHRPSRCT